MSRILLACTPAPGHATPLVALAAHLVERGHDVAFTTTARFADLVSAAGARFVALDPAADTYDLMITNPDRELRRGRRIRGLVRDISEVFVNPAPLQYRGLAGILAGFDADVLVVDTTYVGAVPYLLRPFPRRPAVVVLGVLPLPVASRDTAPFGTGLAPGRGPAGRCRDAALNWLVPHVVLAGVWRNARRVVASSGMDVDVGGIGTALFDVPATRADAYLQTTVPGFEYPRRDLPPAVRFVGPVLPPPVGSFTAPEWWGRLEEAGATGRRVVHVTQGTLDNADLTRLIGPTLQALAGRDAFVVATTGGPDPMLLAHLAPANAVVERFVPHDRLLPHVDVMVTNGGYGGVHQALARGVPLVVAGDSEDKPEVAARVAWSGVGVNLRTGRPSPRRLARAVERVLGEPTYRLRAGDLAAAIAGTQALDEAATVIEQLAGD